MFYNILVDRHIRILLLADSHLGYDQPLHPRIERRRRGIDFFANFQRVLKTARQEKYDLVVHGGDLFFRSKVPPAVVEAAYGELLRVATAGIPVLLVPGNHERSRLPEHLWLFHENILVFDKPRTFSFDIKGKTLAFSGFPFARDVKARFPALLEGTGWREAESDLRYLVAHQTFEGAQVGPVDFTFREGSDNLPGEWVPEEFQAVLAGHIHRAQALQRTLDGRDLAVPIIYPGSIERASFAERFEDKFYASITVYLDEGETRQEIEYHKLPARPMVKLEIPVEDRTPDQVRLLIRERLALIKPDAVVRVDLTGRNRDRTLEALTAPVLRALAPESMNISLGRDWAFQK